MSPSTAVLGATRFAPSPTGNFHLGNLRTAWISNFLARKWGLDWQLRFEDIDKPRVLPGAMESQLQDLAELGMYATQVLIQSQALARHKSLIEIAQEQAVVYPCFCSRREVQQDLAAAASAPHHRTPVYSGRCRNLKEFPPRESGQSSEMVGWRFYSRHSGGDFIVGRTLSVESFDTFTPSYHWACAIDDWDGKYELLVRAADLKGSAEPQREVQRWLRQLEGTSRALPMIFHAALIVQNDGHRLEKRTQGVTLRELKSQGWTVPRILEKFESSFAPACFESRGEFETDCFEPSETITLAQLGF